MHSLTIALRSLRRAPVFTAVAIATLALGIAATTTIFAVVNGVLLSPLPYGNPDRLVAAWYALPGVNLARAQQTAATFFTNRKLAQSIEGIGVYQDGSANVADAARSTEPQRLEAAWVSSGVIPVLQVQPLLGRGFTDAEDLPKAQPVVLISEGLWRSRFGADRAVVGRSLDVNGRSHEIVGVMPERFRFPEAQTKLWLPLALDPANQFPGGFNYNAVVRLKPGVTAVDAQREFDALLPRAAELYPMLAPNVPWTLIMEQAKPSALIVPLRADLTQDIARTLWMVFAAAGLVLLVACANVSNLMLVRADGRQREVAVREALGAGASRIMGHFLVESAVVAAAAGAVGLFLAWVAVRALVAGAPVEIPRLAEVGIGPASIGFALLIVVLVAIVCAIIPALRVGRLKLAQALREGGRSGTTGRAQQRVRGVLVAAQIALALVVLAGSGLLLRTFQRLHAVQPGFDARNVLTLWVSLPRATYASDTAVVQFYGQLTDRVAQLPGVQRVGLASRLPLIDRNMNSSPIFPEGDASYEKKIPPLQLFTTVDSGYFATMGIPLVAGRNFADLRVQSGTDAIVSRRTAQQFWGDSSGAAAVGKRFQQLPGGQFYTVIGVAGDVRDTALAAPATQVVYYSQAVSAVERESHVYRTTGVVVRSSGEARAQVAAVQRVLRDLDPTLPTFAVSSMADVTRRSIARLSFIILILGAAAAVTLVLGAIGLYGVMAYVVTLRTKELGVRIALGAQPRSVAAMMTRQGLLLTGAGVVAGLVAFAAVSRFLQSFLYGTTPLDPVALLGAAGLLLVVAALASFVPAIRASRVDPAEALRAE